MSRQWRKAPATTSGPRLRVTFIARYRAGVPRETSRAPREIPRASTALPLPISLFLDKLSHDSPPHVWLAICGLDRSKE